MKLCEYCGQEFFPNTNQKHCSPKCRRRQVYFKKAIIKRKKIIELGNKCFMCGESNSFVLCIHHKNRNNKDDSKNNLEVLCHNCHFLLHVTGLWTPKLIDWVEKNMGGVLLNLWKEYLYLVEKNGYK